MDVGVGAVVPLDVDVVLLVLPLVAVPALLEPSEAELPPPLPPPHAVISRVRQASAIQLRNGRRCIVSSLCNWGSNFEFE